MEQGLNTYFSEEDTNQKDEQKILVPPRLSLPSFPLEAVQDSLSQSAIPSFPHQVWQTGKSMSPVSYTLSLPGRPVNAVQRRNFRPVPPTNIQMRVQGSFQKVAEANVLQANISSTSQSAQAPQPSRQQEPLHLVPSSRHKKRWQRIPEMRKITAVECGACCLAMILNYYRCTTSVSEVQERCGVGRDGLSALTIVKAARLYGLRVRTVSLKKNDFRFATFPAIAHWEFNHFVVIEPRPSRHVDIIDPALGRRRLSLAEIEDGFTGILIMLEPGAQFERKTSKSNLSLWTYLLSMPHMKGVVTQIIGISFLLQIIGLVAPLLTALIINYIIPTKASNLLMVLGMGMLFLIFMQGIMKLLRTSLLIYLQTRIDAQMMLHFLEHLLSLSYRFFQIRLNGDLLARADSNAAIRNLLTSQIISTLLDGTSVIIYLIVLIMQSKLFAGVTIAIGLAQTIHSRLMLKSDIFMRFVT